MTIVFEQTLYEQTIEDMRNTTREHTWAATH